MELGMSEEGIWYDTIQSTWAPHKLGHSSFWVILWTMFSEFLAWLHDHPLILRRTGGALLDAHRSWTSSWLDRSPSPSVSAGSMEKHGERYVKHSCLWVYSARASTGGQAGDHCQAGVHSPFVHEWLWSLVLVLREVIAWCKIDTDVVMQLEQVRVLTFFHWLTSSCGQWGSHLHLHLSHISETRLPCPAIARDWYAACISMRYTKCLYLPALLEAVWIVSSNKEHRY